MDRNEQVRQQFRQQQELSKMRQQFAAAVASGQAKVLDRIAQPIDKGALVIYRPPHDFVYEVADIKPVLDPRQPPGLVELTLVCTVPVVFVVNQPVMSMIRVGTQHAPGHASLDEPKGDDAAGQQAAQPLQAETVRQGLALIKGSGEGETDGKISADADDDTDADG